MSQHKKLKQPKRDRENLDATMAIRVTSSELLKLKEAADRANQKLGEYVRQRVIYPFADYPYYFQNFSSKLVIDGQGNAVQTIEAIIQINTESRQNTCFELERFAHYNIGDDALAAKTEILYVGVLVAGGDTKLRVQEWPQQKRTQGVFSIDLTSPDLMDDGRIEVKCRLTVKKRFSLHQVVGAFLEEKAEKYSGFEVISRQFFVPCQDFFCEIEFPRGYPETTWPTLELQGRVLSHDSGVACSLDFTEAIEMSNRDHKNIARVSIHQPKVGLIYEILWKQPVW